MLNLWDLTIIVITVVVCKVILWKDVNGVI